MVTYKGAYMVLQALIDELHALKLLVSEQEKHIKALEEKPKQKKNSDF